MGNLDPVKLWEVYWDIYIWMWVGGSLSESLMMSTVLSSPVLYCMLQAEEVGQGHVNRARMQLSRRGLHAQALTYYSAAI